VSLGVDVLRLPGHGPPVFFIDLNFYHHMRHLQVGGEFARLFADFYFMDNTQEANEARMRRPANQRIYDQLLEFCVREVQQNN
jgi:hypothetical protein